MLKVEYKKIIVPSPEVKEESASPRRRHLQDQHTKKRCQGCAKGAPERLVLDNPLMCVTGTSVFYRPFCKLKIDYFYPGKFHFTLNQDNEINIRQGHIALPEKYYIYLQKRKEFYAKSY